MSLRRITRAPIWLLRSRAGRFALGLRVACWIAALSVLARMLPLPRVLRMLDPGTGAAGDPNATNEIAGCVDALLATNFLCFRPNCWKRSLVLYRYMRLAGVPVRVVFGVRKAGDRELDGHAWIERDGEAVLDSAPEAYVVTYSYPA